MEELDFAAIVKLIVSARNHTPSQVIGTTDKRCPVSGLLDVGSVLENSVITVCARHLLSSTLSAFVLFGRELRCAAVVTSDA